MDGFNRFFIFLLLLGLLYALYRYQEHIVGAEDIVHSSPGIERKLLEDRKKDKHRYNKKLPIPKQRSHDRETGRNLGNKKGKLDLIDEESVDGITVDNVSQFSIGSDDLNTRDQAHQAHQAQQGGYKQDSALNSVDSNESLNSADFNETNGSGTGTQDSNDAFFFNSAR